MTIKEKQGTPWRDDAETIRIRYCQKNGDGGGFYVTPYGARKMLLKFYCQIQNLPPEKTSNGLREEGRIIGEYILGQFLRSCEKRGLIGTLPIK